MKEVKLKQITKLEEELITNQEKLLHIEQKISELCSIKKELMNTNIRIYELKKKITDCKKPEIDVSIELEAFGTNATGKTYILNKIKSLLIEEGFKINQKEENRIKITTK